MKVRNLIAALVAAAFATPAVAQVELKFGHVAEPGSLIAVNIEDYAKRVNEKLAGKVKVSVFGSSQLGNDRELLQKLKLGTVDIAFPTTVMSSEVDLYGLFELPYLVKDRGHMGRIEKEIFWPTIAPATEKKGLKVLAVWENGYRHITNNVRPITKPDDLKGIKLRTPRGKWRVKMFEAYGASPSPLAFSEVFTALKTGVMDGQENPFANIWSAKFHEVQKYLSLTGHVYTPGYVVVGSKRWATHPAELSKMLEDMARAHQAVVYKTAIAMETDLLGKLKAGGIAVNEADKDAFIAASKSIYEAFGADVKGAQPLIDRAIALGKK